MDGPATASAQPAEDTEVPPKLREVPRGPSLRSRLQRGATWTMFTFGSGQAIRLVSNVVMTRLLSPYAYGLMAWVDMILKGVNMFTDLGTAPAIIRHRMGTDPAFLNTAWTLGILRGVIVWIVASLAAWPVALIAGEPLLNWLLPVTAFSSIIGSFQSTSIHTCRRSLALGRLSAMTLAAQVVSVGVIIWWGFLLGSVWAFVAGGIAGACARLILSHTLLPGIHNQIAWHKEHGREIFNFGRWIFLSTVLTYIGQQGDRLILAFFVETSTLGIFTLAAAVCEVFPSLAEALSRQVAFPGLSVVSRERNAEMKRAFYRVRLVMDTALIPAVGLLCGMAMAVVDILYPDNYAAAGWMLRLLCLRAAIRSVSAICQQCLVAANEPRYAFKCSLARVLWTLPLLCAAWYFFGLTGIITAVAFTELPALTVLYVGLHRKGLLSMLRESLVLAYFLGGLLVGLGLESLVRPFL